MTISLKMPDIRELKPRITVFGVGGAGGNAVNNMITAGLVGCDFVVANTDAQALTLSKAERIIQMGVQVTEGLGAGSQPDVGRAAAEEVVDEIRDHLSGAHMVFITAGMGGGTGTGSAPVVARVARELGILAVGVVTKPFHFEGGRRMRIAEAGIQELQSQVDTLLVIPNQNLFRVANERTTFADAFAMADQVLYSGVACITDLMVKEGLINLDFADVRAIMREMGRAMMGTGEASGEKRAMTAAEAAIANPLIDDSSMKGARGLLISITGGKDLTLYEVDEAATRIREEVDHDANIIVGATFDESLDGIIRVSVVATGIDQAIEASTQPSTIDSRLAELTQKLRSNSQRFVERAEPALRPAAESASRVGRAPEPPVVEPARPAPPPVALASPVGTAGPSATEIEDVVLRPIPPKPSLFLEPVDEQPAATATDAAHNRAFIPPAAERPVKPPRMPRVDELPLPAQNEIRASRGEPTEQPAMEKRRSSLLQRLASVGLGRRDEPGDDAATPEGRAAAPSNPGQPAAAPAARRVDESRTQDSRTQDMVSEYAKRAPVSRSAPQGLDPLGRPAPIPVRDPMDEDHLEIPACLRRQAN
jgi:cell division protein FtsZ